MEPYYRSLIGPFKEPHPTLTIKARLVSTGPREKGFSCRLSGLQWTSVVGFENPLLSLKKTSTVFLNPLLFFKKTLYCFLKTLLWGLDLEGSDQMRRKHLLKAQIGNGLRGRALLWARGAGHLPQT